MFNDGNLSKYHHNDILAALGISVNSQYIQKSILFLFLPEFDT